MYQAAGKFYKIDPHGAVFGYMTQLGVVQVPDEPVHGYTWDGTGDGRWVLCAVYPPDQRSRVTTKWKSLREKG